MYDQIADIYLEIFPLNQAFLAFIPEYLGAPGATVLDLGCGPGDYVDQLTRSGYQATGIDNSPGMIAQAQTHKRGVFHELSFTEIDQLQDRFDCIYCVGNSLSYLPMERLAPFLEDVHSLLKDAGRFIIQVVNWDKYELTGSADFGIITLSDERTFHRNYEQVDRTQVIFYTTIMQDGITQHSWSAPLYPKYGQVMVDGFQNAGLTVTGQFGDYQKSPFDPHSSPALILAVQKEEPYDE